MRGTDNDIVVTQLLNYSLFCCYSLKPKKALMCWTFVAEVCAREVDKCASCTCTVPYLSLCSTIALVNMATKLITRFYKLKYLNTFSCYLPNLLEPCTRNKARFTSQLGTLVFQFTLSFIPCFPGF